jgi:hypothetical protein
MDLSALRTRHVVDLSHASMWLQYSPDVESLHTLDAAGPGRNLATSTGGDSM